jgi:serine/threonine protein kinase/CheY-like chemotaxis protein
MDAVPANPTDSEPASLQTDSALPLSRTLAVEDLSGDDLLRGVPREMFSGRSVPRLGKVFLLARIGKGGMGSVYYGAHASLDIDIAVKILPNTLAAQEPTLVKRFYREAKIAARVRSPHLVDVFDVDQQHGLIFLVMEFVHGLSAAQHLLQVKASGSKGLDERDATEIVYASLRGLEALHANGFVHRDLKPGNILIPFKRDGEGLDFSATRLADLGLARDEAGPTDGEPLTAAFSAMGTVGYMPPEQIQDARKAGKPADVFSAGATLYTLLTGRTPFLGKTAWDIMKHTVETPHVSLRDIRSDVSFPIVKIIDRCLAKNAAERYADAATLLQALARIRPSRVIELPAQDSTNNAPTVVSNYTPTPPALNDQSIADAFIAEGMLTSADVDALLAKRESGQSLLDALLAGGKVNDFQIAEVLSRKLVLPHVRLSTLSISPDVLVHADKAFCQKNRCIPVKWDEKNNLVLAQFDPFDAKPRQEIETREKIKVERVIASLTSIQDAIRNYYGATEALGKIVGQLADSGVENSSSVEAGSTAGDSRAVVKLANQIITDALRAQATEICIVPNVSFLSVRYKLEPDYIEALTLPKWLQNPLLARLRRLARISPDAGATASGQFSIEYHGRKVPLNLAMKPSQFGSAAVLCIGEDTSSALRSEAVLSAVEALNCPACNQVIEASFRGCPYCGHALKKMCVQCKLDMKPEWRVCPHCRTRVEEPLEPALNAATTSPSSPPAAQTTSGSKLSATSGFDTLQILVVDDDPMMSRLVALFLRKVIDDADIVYAKNGIEALEHTAKRTPHLVVTDIQMPEMDGLEFCRRLRADIRTAFLPVLMLTASSETEARQQAFSVGADEFVLKPPDPAVLLDKIKRLLHRVYGL